MHAFVTVSGKRNDILNCKTKAFPFANLKTFGIILSCGTYEEVSNASSYKRDDLHLQWKSSNHLSNAGRSQPNP
jgi:hypothetical protein